LLEAVVTLLSHALQVACIEEQTRIALVWGLVVYHCCRLTLPYVMRALTEGLLA
jgi:hypothetical protein